jgi:hypothetical protein
MLEYHLDQMDKSKFMGKNQNPMENLFWSFWDSFPKCFSYIYYTYLKNDWFFNYSLNCWEIQEAFLNRSNIYPIQYFQFQALFLYIITCIINFLHYYKFINHNLFLFYLFYAIFFPKIISFAVIIIKTWIFLFGIHFH